MIRSAVSSASFRPAAMPSKVGSTARSSLTPRRFTGVRRRRPGAGVRRVRSRHRTAHRQMPDDGISRIPTPGPAPPEFRARRCRSACGRSPSHAHNRHSDRAADRRIQARKAHREKRSPLFSSFESAQRTDTGPGRNARKQEPTDRTDFSLQHSMQHKETHPLVRFRIVRERGQQHQPDSGDALQESVFALPAAVGSGPCGQCRGC